MRVSLLIARVATSLVLGMTTTGISADTNATQAVKAQATDAQRGLTIIALSKIDQTLLTRLQDHMRESFACLVQTQNASGMVSDLTTQEVPPALKNVLNTNAACVVCILDVSQDPGFLARIMKAQHLGFLNIATLRPVEESDSSGEVFAMRVEKELVGLAGSVLGLQICPMPRCAMSQWKDLKELDAKGLNLCPPCFQKAHDILVKAGVPPISSGLPKKSLGEGKAGKSAQ